MAYKTQNTVVAVFRNSADARAAASELGSTGIAREDIFLETNSAGTSAGTGTTVRPGDDNRHAGGISRWLKSRLGDERDRTTYEGALQGGHSVLRLDVADDQISSVEDILSRHSPIDIHEEGARESIGRELSQSPAGASSLATPAIPDQVTNSEIIADQITANRSMAHSTMADPSEMGNRQTSLAADRAADLSNPDQAIDQSGRAIPVLREDLQVSKRRVLRGGVRVYSRMVEQPFEENVSLREEHVHVDRRPVDRVATESELRGGDERVVEVQEFAEEPVISKQARVVEEVHIGKDVTDRQKIVRDTLRHTEVSVEQLPKGGNTSQFDDTGYRDDFQTRYGATGGSYDTYEPAYRYGSELAGDPRFKGRSFEDSESELQTEYSHRYPESMWDRMKDAVRYGWDRTTGQARSATS